MPHQHKPEEPGKEHWRGKQYAFFRHEACEFFPCHPTDDLEDFNCLFCYCPLYALGERCGGNFTYSPGGVKDCSRCLLPHKRGNYGFVIGRFRELQEAGRLLKICPPTKSVGGRYFVLQWPMGLEGGIPRKYEEKVKIFLQEKTKFHMNIIFGKYLQFLLTNILNNNMIWINEKSILVIWLRSHLNPQLAYWKSYRDKGRWREGSE